MPIPANIANADIDSGAAILAGGDPNKAVSSKSVYDASVLGNWGASTGGSGVPSVNGITSAVTIAGAGVSTSGSVVKITSSTYVNVRDWGAVCDGVTDDTVAVQNAINYCFTFPQPASLLVPALTRTTAPLIANNPVGAQKQYFHVIGLGGGFITANPIAIFDSSLPYGANAGQGASPPACCIAFHGVVFKVDNPATAATSVSGKFLHVYFDPACEWRGIKIVNSTTYLQSWNINGTAWSWQGVLVDCVGSFDLRIAVKGESGGAYWRSIGGIQNFGASVDRALYEGSTGPFIEADTIDGLTITSPYLEQNTASNFKFVSGKGVLLVGGRSMLTSTNAANTNFYDAQWNSTAGMSIGFGCAGRLHDNTNSPMRSIGDTATIAVAKVPQVHDGISVTTNPVVTAVTGTLSAYTCTLKYKKLTPNLAFYSLALKVTANGTGAGSLKVPMPFTAVGALSLSGQNAGTGKAVSGICGSGNNILYVAQADNTYPTSADIYMSGFGEI